MVVNASNINKDFDWLTKNSLTDVNIENVSDKISLIAIQGPHSREVLSSILNIDLKMPYYSFLESVYKEYPIIVSRTGYTGELGYEFYGCAEIIIQVWNKLLDNGVEPAGLAARDILRLEMAYCLYGNDITTLTNPIEAGLSWIVSCEKGRFIGSDSILNIKKDGHKRKLVAFIMEERGIPRPNYEVFYNNKKIGFVTSGTQSLKLNKGIGLAYIENSFYKLGQQINIHIRNKPVKAIIITPPFISDTSLYH